jgi:hypothetical protein
MVSGKFDGRVAAGLDYTLAGASLMDLATLTIVCATSDTRLRHGPHLI